MPKLISTLAPKGALEIHEKAWNCYPYCKTVISVSLLWAAFISIYVCFLVIFTVCILWHWLHCWEIICIYIFFFFFLEPWLYEGWFSHHYTDPACWEWQRRTRQCKCTYCYCCLCIRVHVSMCVIDLSTLLTGPQTRQSQIGKERCYSCRHRQWPSFQFGK